MEKKVRWKKRGKGGERENPEARRGGRVRGTPSFITKEGEKVRERERERERERKKEGMSAVDRYIQSSSIRYSYKTHVFNIILQHLSESNTVSR